MPSTVSRIASGVYAARVAVLGLLACTVCERDTPCLEWLQLGQVYTVDLVQHLDLDSDGQPLPPGYRLPSAPCPSTLDMAVGSTLSLTPWSKSETWSSRQCDDGCFYSRARIAIPHVTVRREITGGEPQVVPYLVAQADVELDGCKGRLVVSVHNLGRYFENYSTIHVASDHVLDRTFYPAQDPECWAERGLTEPCWDTWAVRVRDSSGRVVTRDLQRRPGHTDPDAGRDSSRDDDAGNGP